ncbi:MAG TPA: cellulose binding domain-containing protein, partial [Polyangia bacterium]|nr:cellulose binding domain-containing protein [Polyangia bacterium]
MRAAGHILFAAALCGFVFFACQGPDEYFRNGSPGSGTGGATATGGAGTGLVSATGGTVAASGGSVGTGSGGVLGTGGSSAGAAGSAGKSGGGAGGRGAAGSRGTGGATSAGGAGGGAIGLGGRSGGGGAGGATGAAGAGPCTTTCKLVIDAACQLGTSKQEARVVIDLVNNSSSPLPLNQVTLRYWFQASDMPPTPTFTVDYSMSVQSAMMTSKFVPLSPARTGANEYLEIGFTMMAPTLSLFSDTGQIQLRFANYGSVNLFVDQTQDYSFQACPA